jgi:hypothetical protein
MVAISSVFFATSFGTSENQKSSAGSKTYTNTDYNIRIEYPNNWKKSETDLDAHVIVVLTAPDTKDVTDPAGFTISNFQISDNSKLDDFVTYFFKDKYPQPEDYKLIESSNATVAGMNGRQFILYEYQKSLLEGFPGSTLKVMRVLALDTDTNNGYSLKYWAQPSLFKKYLPTAQRMIDSFGTVNAGTQNITAAPEQK